MTYKFLFNPLSNRFDYVVDSSLLNFKEGVSTYTALPTIGNSKNDGRIANDTGHLYIWSLEASTGLLTDWTDQGDIFDIDWSAITNKPSSSVADIDDAVSKKHSQGTDQGLDTGGANAVTAAQAKAGYTHSGVIFGNPHNVSKTDVGLGNVDNISEATIIADVKADTDVASAISLKHSQNTDQYIDLGGVSETTAAEIRNAADLAHEQNTDETKILNGKEANIVAITKGQAVCFAGSSGTKIQFGLANCTSSSKDRIIGIAKDNIDKNANGIIVVEGLLTGIDTRASNTDVNPYGETWLPGDLLWLAGVDGGLTNVRPTSGRCIKVARTVKGNSNTDELIIIAFENPVWVTGAAGEDIVLRVGDIAGANKVSIRDYVNSEVASITSDGVIIGSNLSGTNTGDQESSDFTHNSLSGLNDGDYKHLTATEKSDIDDAVSKKHTQGTDQGLDNGGANAVTAAQVKQAVTDDHTHSNKTELDKLTDGDHDVRTDNPHGVTKAQVGLTNVDDKSEATIITDVKADSDVADAISKKHTQGTDTTLGNMVADVNMNSHKLTGLSIPSSTGESVRTTTKITESNLESAIDNIITTVSFTDYSVSSTIVGWSSFITKKIMYARFGKMVLVVVDLYGTSNSTTITFTVPYTSVNAVVGFQGVITSSYDNSVLRTIKDITNVPANSTICSAYKDNIANNWTASGNKGITVQFIYMMA